MKRALCIAFALCVPMVESSVAAHPAHYVGGFQGGTNWLIPDPDAAKESPDSAATTGTNAGISNNNGKIFASEIARGFDVMNLSGAFDDGGLKVPYFNAQTQEPLRK